MQIFKFIYAYSLSFACANNSQYQHEDSHSLKYLNISDEYIHTIAHLHTHNCSLEYGYDPSFEVINSFKLHDDVMTYLRL